jgi:uncharacterized protein DUF3352
MDVLSERTSARFEHRASPRERRLHHRKCFMMRFQRALALRALRLGLLASVLAASVSVRPALCAGPVDGSEAAQLPSGTLFFASVAGVDELNAQLKQTGLWNVLQKLPEVPQKLQEGWNQGIAEFEKNSGLSFNDVWTLLSGRMSFALVDLDIAAAEQGTPPGLLLTLDLSGHMDQWNSLVVQKLLPQIDKDMANKNGTRTESDFQGSKLHTFSDHGKEIFYAVAHKDRFVLATRKSLIEGFYQGASGSSLKDDAHYAWARKNLGTPGYVLLYANVADLWKAIHAYASNRPNLSPDEQRGLKVVDELGLDSLTAMGYTSSVVKGGVLDRFVLGFTSQPKGIVKLMAQLKPGSPGSIKLAPKDAVLYSGSSIGNVGALFAEVRRILGTALAPEEMAKFDAGLAKFKENTGLDLEKDVLAKFSGEIGMAIALPDLPVALLDNPIVGALGKLNELQLAVYCGTEDGAGVEAQLQSILQKANVNVTTEQYNGVTYHLITIPNSPVFPGYAVIGNQIVMGMNVLTLKTAIDQSKGGAGLESSDRYKAAMSNLTIGEGCATSYMDLPGVLGVAGRLAAAYFDKAKQKGEPLPFDPATLPKPEELAAFVPPVAGRSTIGPDGMVAEYYSPIGYMTQMVFSSGISAYQQARQRASSLSSEESSTAPSLEDNQTHPAAEATPESGPSSEQPSVTPPTEKPSGSGETASGSGPAASGSETTASESPATTSESAGSGSKSGGTSSGTAASGTSSSVSGTGTSASGSTPSGTTEAASGSAPTGPVKAKKAPGAPEGWTVASSTENMASYLSGDFQANAAWFRTPFSPYLKLESFIDQVKSSSSSMPDFKVLQEGTLEIGGLKGRELAYEYGESPSRQRVRLIYLQDGTNLYTLTLQCSVAKCDTYKKAFDAILDNLK